MTQRPLDVRICCPKCGSTHFVLQEFRQYYADIYSSVPGGEISDLGKGVNVRVCLCDSRYDCRFDALAAIRRIPLKSKKRDWHELILPGASWFAGCSGRESCRSHSYARAVMSGGQAARSRPHSTDSKQLTLVTSRSAKPLFVGSIPTRASI
jgi:hypothetical protein